MEAHFLQLQLVGGIDAQQMHTAQQCADTLGDGGCHGGSAHTPVENRDKQQIQHHIDTGGENQVVQRVLTVAHGMENAHKNIVQDAEHSTAEIEPEIGNRLGKNLLRGAHPAQNGGAECNTKNGQKDTGGETEGYICMDGLAHAFKILCAEVTGDNGTRAHGHTVEKADHHKDQTAGGTDGGKGILADEIAYAPGVEGIIKLLEQIAHQDGKRKEDNLFPNRTFRQGVAVVHLLHFFLNVRCIRNNTVILLSYGIVKPGHIKAGGIEMTDKQYGKLVDELSPKSPMGKDCLNAFWIGGLICTIGQIFLNVYGNLGLDKEMAGTATSMTLVCISALLTGLSVYDDIAKHAGAGTLVPITGFANSIAAPAVEFKTEGMVLGVGGKMFQIAGPVIVYGVSASVVYGLIYWITTLF